MTQKLGKQIRGKTYQIIVHLARILGQAVADYQPDHQQNPGRDRSHWWQEIKEWLRQIRDMGWSEKQLLRELPKGVRPSKRKT